MPQTPRLVFPTLGVIYRGLKPVTGPGPEV
jgi:hypothetical protein